MDAVSRPRIFLVIKEVVERKLDVKLDTASFMFDNIRPDYFSSFITTPRFNDNAMVFIASESKNLMQYKIKRMANVQKNFSERLGGITRYLSVFFCYAHSTC